MKSLLLAVAVVLILLLWQIDRVTASRDALSVSLLESQGKAAGLQATLQAQREKLQILTALDTKYSQELTYAQSENERLAADIASGKRRLLIKTSCPSNSGLPGTATTTRVDDGSTAELSASARQDYYTLRRQLTKTDKALAGLQAYVSEVCRP